MHIRLLVLVLVISHASVVAQSHIVYRTYYEQGDTLYVWAVNGMMLRAEPDLNSKIVMKLAYGQQLIAGEITDRDVPYEVMPAATIQKQNIPAITVRGKFIRINLSGTTGYVYGGLLSPLKPANPGEGFENYFDHAFGLLKVTVDEISDNKEIKFKRIVYQNGAILQEALGGGGWGYAYFIPDISLQEAYLLYNSVMDFEKQYRQSIETSDVLGSFPVSFEEGKIMLEHGSFDTTEIRILDRYIMITSNGGN
jgi:hypothetical protein